MPTRGFAAVLNQGLATLGEKLGKTSVQERAFLFIVMAPRLSVD
jgi:hypothetical protein